MERQVMVELQININDDGEKEVNKTKSSGKLFETKDRTVLTYEEKLDEQATIKNLITIQPEKVTIKRSGVVSMNQQFRTNQVTENVYFHPHGNMHMETFTNSIQHEAPDGSKAGNLAIHYTVKLNGQTERKHALKLTYIKEDAE